MYFGLERFSAQSSVRAEGIGRYHQRTWGQTPHSVVGSLTWYEVDEEGERTTKG